jgi:hypothetical protein
VADLRTLTAAEAAAVAGVSYRTWARWLDRWLALRVIGVDRVRLGRARGGYCWRLAPDIVDRWRRGELPSPHTHYRL